MKKIIFLAVALIATSIAIWWIWLPIGDSFCSRQPAATTTLKNFVTGYFKDNNNRDWRESTNVFDIFFSPDAQNISENSPLYYCEALSLLENPMRTQTEKVYTAILMLRLPIEYYLSLMDHTHQLYKEGRIDDTVLTFVLQPRGTAFNYWWLPQWRLRFSRDAHYVYTPENIEYILYGQNWLNYPGGGH